MADDFKILRKLALQVRNAELAGENSAERVGRTFVGILDLIDDLKNVYIHKNQPDETEFLIKFFGGLYSSYIQSVNFSSGPLGEGYVIKVDPDTGKSYIEVDELFVRMKAMFTELDIKKLSYTGGNYIFSAAGMKCAKVEEYDTYWRCYLMVDDGATAVENPFRVDDQIRFQEFNIKPGVYEDVSNRYYWRLCVGIGADYIDLSKTDCDANSDAPQEGDSLVQLGNRTDKKRQNAIELSVYGDDAPSIHQYAGIDSYTMAGKEVTVISPKGNKFIGDFVLKTGVNILTQFQVLENLIYSEISKVYDEVQAKDNYLYNAAFASNMSGWETTNNIRFFTINGKFFYFNDNFYSRKDNMAAIVRYGERNVLRIIDSGIRQANVNLANKPEYSGNEELRKFFISFRYRVVKAGTLTVGFPEKDLYFTERLEINEEYQFKEYSGLWDSTGDFALKFTGEMYLHSLALTDNAFEDMFTIFNTKIEQTNKKISLLAESMSESMNSLASEIQVTAEGIEATNKKVNTLDGTVREMGISINGITENLSLYVKKDGLGSEINVALDNITVQSRNIYFKGNISANGNVSIQEDGTIKAIGGEFSGKLKGATGDFSGSLKGATGEFTGKVSIANGKILLNSDGSGRLANGKVSWNSNGDSRIDASVILEGFAQAGYMGTAIKVQTTGYYTYYIGNRDIYTDCVVVNPINANDTFALPGDSSIWMGRVLYVYNISSNIALKIMGASKSIPAKGCGVFLGGASVSSVLMTWALVNISSGENLMGYQL